MRYCIYTDVHFSTYSSIIRSRDIDLSKRLKNNIASVNWAEDLAEKENCDAIICLGDFFNSPDLTSEELTALNQIKWSDKLHYFLVGNHDASTKNLEFNSINALRNVVRKNIIIDGEYAEWRREEDYPNKPDFGLIFIPYLEDDVRKTIKEYKETSGIPQDLKFIVFSHNDVKCNYGRYSNTTGFDIDDIENNCSIFLNGHIHNLYKFCKNGFNIGNLTGQNFGEDAFNHMHAAWILDTITSELYPIENPYAYNFYQIDINKEEDLSILDTLKTNAVVSFRCDKELVAILKERIKNTPNIVESKVIFTLDAKKIAKTEVTLVKNDGDHLTQFRDFSFQKLGDSDVVKEEVNKVIGG